MHACTYFNHCKKAFLGNVCAHSGKKKVAAHYCSLPCVCWKERFSHHNHKVTLCVKKRNKLEGIVACRKILNNSSYFLFTSFSRGFFFSTSTCISGLLLDTFSPDIDRHDCCSRKNVKWVFRRCLTSFDRAQIFRETCEYFFLRIFEEFYS